MLRRCVCFRGDMAFDDHDQFGDGLLGVVGVGRWGRCAQQPTSHPSRVGVPHYGWVRCDEGMEGRGGLEVRPQLCDASDVVDPICCVSSLTSFSSEPIPASPTEVTTTP